MAAALNAQSIIMEHAKQKAQDILYELGFSVFDIPESTSGEKRADLVAVDEAGHQYIIEVKQRLEDAERQKVSQERLAQGEVVLSHESCSYENRMDRIMRSGFKQLNATPKKDGAFVLLWLHAEGMDSELKTDRARNTFYGIVQLMPVARAPRAVECFYFDFCTSMRMPEVHGLVLVDAQGLQLCVNEFSVRADEFRKTSFAQCFGSAIVDPPASEAKGDAMVFRSSMSRKNESEVLDAVERSENKRFLVLRPKTRIAAAMVSREEQKSS